MVIFRENTEDIYAGIEWQAESRRGQEGHRVPAERDGREEDPLPGDLAASASSRSRAKATERLIRAAIEYALRHKRKSVTLVHKGNIMKFTEGGLPRLGLRPDQARVRRQGRSAGTTAAASRRPARSLVKDSIADITLQQVLTRPDEFDVIATLNLNGDYLSDALAAQVGGIGIAPGGNINYVTGHADLRGDARHGAEVRQPGQGEPRLGHPLGRHDARAPRLDEAADAHHQAALEKTHRAEDRHLRLRAPDGGSQRGLVLRVRRRDHLESSATPDLPRSPIPCHGSEEDRAHRRRQHRR